VSHSKEKVDANQSIRSLYFTKSLLKQLLL